MKLRALLEPCRAGSYDNILAMARAVEESGLDGFFRSDHLLGVDPADRTYQPTDSWATLAGLARETRRIRLGTLVTAGTFRAPGLLATTVAVVDAMSGGRVELGIGAGWYPEEHLAFGVGFPRTGERFDRLEEQLSIITGLWDTPDGEPFSFDGKHYQVFNPGVLPRTAQRPHPPLIIGGTGVRRTPALAARFADEFNLAFPHGIRERRENFDRICDETGRDPSTVRKSVILPVACGTSPAEIKAREAALPAGPLRAEAVVGRPEDVLERLAELRREGGVDTVYFHLYDTEDSDHVRLLGAEVLPGL
ncbi:TIGR03560 family F420-dependent LLM class oxidoreductase [Streptomyces sp. NPDC007901]|uniref:TIGR03560 family F420-dependent LLM class oxidoreductase n=1 Tax=Streptomyces sp. NPDC007901 TaxID=3364785 RepID=UPI0036EDF5BF